MESLIDLDSSLSKLGSRLFVARGKPEVVIPELIDRWKIDKLTFEYDSEPYAKERDKNIENVVKAKGMKVSSVLPSDVKNPGILHLSVLNVHHIPSLLYRLWILFHHYYILCAISFVQEFK